MTKKKLLFSITKKDFEIKFFSGTGAGGQHRNKHQNCVRMKHTSSNIHATGQSNKSKEANLKEAFLNIINKPEFKAWHKREIAYRLQEDTSLDEKIKRMMAPENLKIEIIQL